MRKLLNVYVVLNCLIVFNSGAMQEETSLQVASSSDRALVSTQQQDIAARQKDLLNQLLMRIEACDQEGKEKMETAIRALSVLEGELKRLMDFDDLIGQDLHQYELEDKKTAIAVLLARERQEILAVDKDLIARLNVIRDRMNTVMQSDLNEQSKKLRDAEKERAEALWFTRLFSREQNGRYVQPVHKDHVCSCGFTHSIFCYEFGNAFYSWNRVSRIIKKVNAVQGSRSVEELIGRKPLCEAPSYSAPAVFDMNEGLDFPRHPFRWREGSEFELKRREYERKIREVEESVQRTTEFVEKSFVTFPVHRSKNGLGPICRPCSKNWLDLLNK